MWIAERLFDTAGFPDVATYADLDALPTNSLGQPTTFGPLTPEGAEVTIRPLPPDTAAVAVTVTVDADTTDLYLHFDEADRFVALRRLALPGLFWMFYDLLDTWERVRDAPNPVSALVEGLDPTLVENLGLDASGRGLDQLIGSVEALDTMLVELPNLRLTVASDVSLKGYFEEHRASLERIVAAYAADPTLAHVLSDERGEPGAAVADVLRDLHLNRAFRGTMTGDDGVSIGIGGMLDNEVGYLYVPAGAQPPRMRESNYIYVEPLGGGWYLFKTT